MRPSRELFRQADQTYFASFQTARRQCFFRNERWSALFLNTLEHYLPQTGLHDFVIMPDHIHLLLSPQVPLERAIQLIKGGYSFRAKRELQWSGDLWQVGFTDHRVRSLEDWDTHTEYIRENALSVQSGGNAICAKDSSLALHPLPPWLKPPLLSSMDGGAEAPPLQSMRPEGMCPESMRPEGMCPESMRPEGMYPESMRPQSMRPEGMCPESMRPESVRPESFSSQEQINSSTRTVRF